VSKLAESLDGLEIPRVITKRRAACFALYGDCDLEDQNSIAKLHDDGVVWEQIQASVDELLEIPAERRINNRKFVRHWRGECSCWETPKVTETV
jgi:hypothetical protein